MLGFLAGQGHEGADEEVRSAGAGKGQSQPQRPTEQKCGETCGVRASQIRAGAGAGRIEQGAQSPTGSHQAGALTGTS